MTGEYVAPGVIANLGGTPGKPDPYFNPSSILAKHLPALPHAEALAGLLGIHRNTLTWLAARPFDSKNNQTSHYTRREIPKSSGGKRVLMIPLPELKAVQRTLLNRLLNKLPVSPAAHGFCKGRDVLTGAAYHIGRPVVICMDIEEFFPSFTFRRVSGYFRSLGYGRGIAGALGNLMTERMMSANVRNSRGKWQYARGLSDVPGHIHPELPQGAPTSPTIANAICWRMDKRLTALARSFGGYYTRYADDLTFSGFEKLGRHANFFIKLVAKIIDTEGLKVNAKKTRIMRKGRQQRVTGVVVNKQTNLSRRDFDLLKAILHNCIKKGPSTQNRSNHPNFKEHLRGRVAHALHIGPERGAKLKKLFDAIDWSR